MTDRRRFPPPCRGCFDVKPERLNEPFFLRPIFALSFAAFMVASGLSSDAARAERQRSASFDGLWSVVIVTLQGSCDRSYRYPVRIVGNRVLQAGADPGYRLYGA